MTVITISRGSYSRGKEVAEKLADRLGYECISRDILLETSDEFNIPEIQLVRALHDPLSVLNRFIHGKEKYMSYIFASFLQHICKDNIVYHGLAGHYLLGNIAHVLKVRIIADMQDRVKEEMRRENISEEKALYILQKDDEERRKWSMQMYGTDTWDSRLYDIVIRTGRLTVDDAVDILYDVARKPVYQTTTESKKMVDNLALAAKIKADLIKIAPGIKVFVDDDKAFINDLDANIYKKEKTKITDTTMNVKGIKEVVFNMKPAREQSGHVNPFQNIG